MIYECYLDIQSAKINKLRIVIIDPIITYFLKYFWELSSILL